MHCKSTVSPILQCPNYSENRLSWTYGAILFHQKWIFTTHKKENLLFLVPKKGKSSFLVPKKGKSTFLVPKKGKSPFLVPKKEKSLFFWVISSFKELPPGSPKKV